MGNDISPGFYQKYYDLVQDKILDKKDVEALKGEVKTAADQALLDQVVGADEFKMTFESDPKGENAKWKPTTVSFGVAANYNLDDAVPGSTREEMVANIGQGDALLTTKSDQSRCAAAACVNAVILDDGAAGFAKLAKSLGLRSTDLTYRNVHLAQDALYRKARQGKDGSDYRDGSTGSFLNIKTSWTYDGKDGHITGGKATGTIVDAAKAAGFGTEPILFANKDNRSDRQFAVESFFANNTSGSIIVGVHKDDDGSIRSGDENHAVLVTYKDGKYFMCDSWGANGKGNNRREISDQEVQQLLFNTNANMLGLSH